MLEYVQPSGLPTRPVGITEKNQSWRQFAACKGEDVNLFFPSRRMGRPPNQIMQDIKTAKEICGRCPGRTGCLDYGLYEKYGIWGGLTPHERKAARSTRPLPVRPNKRKTA